MPNILRWLPAVLLVITAHAAYGQEATNESSKPQATAGSTAEPGMEMTLVKGMTLKGTPVDLETIQMNTIFGEAKIPVHTIAGIRFSQKPGTASTVVLQNGDLITGQILLGQIKFVSQWGEATVNTGSVESIVFANGLRWTGTNTVAGQRWTLSRGQAVSPATSNNQRVYRSRTGY
ncbi:MAG: hypothetical protein R3E01_28680 [Pirellulaceae bacterium]|nr:hypothetical protein [Planctomycetales bacterium]